MSCHYVTQKNNTLTIRELRFQRDIIAFLILSLDIECMKDRGHDYIEYRGRIMYSRAAPVTIVRTPSLLPTCKSEVLHGPSAKSKAPFVRIKFGVGFHEPVGTEASRVRV